MLFGTVSRFFFVYLFVYLVSRTATSWCSGCSSPFMFSFFCHLQKLFRLLSAWCVIFKSSCPPHTTWGWRKRGNERLKKCIYISLRCVIYLQNEPLETTDSAIKITAFISGRSDQICCSSVILVLYKLQFVLGSAKMLDDSLGTFFIFYCCDGKQ